MEPAAGGIGLGEVHDDLAPVERKIHADGNERAKDRAEHAPFAHMEPIRLDLDDGNRAVALEIHVHRIQRRIGDDHVHLQFSHHGEIRQHAEQDVGDGRADGGDEDAAFAANLVHQRPIDQK